MIPPRVITIAGDAEGEARLLEILGRSVGLFMRCTDKIGALAALRSERVDAVVIVGVPAWLDRGFAAEARSHGVSLVGVTNDAFEADHLLELGCMLTRPDADPHAIVLACSTGFRDERSDTRGGAGQLVAVWGHKGAPGCSSIATEIAYLCAAKEERTCLVDADTRGGDLLEMLGVQDELPSIVWASGIAASVGRAGLIDRLKRVGEKGPILLAGISPTQRPTVSPGGWGSLLECLRGIFALTVIDAGSASPSEVDSASRALACELATRAISEADRVICVVDASPQGLRHFGWSHAAIADLSSRPPTVVLSRARHGEARELAALVNERFGYRVVACVPWSPDSFERARRVGRAVAEIEPSGEVAKALEPVLDSLGQKRRASGVLTRLGGRGG